MAASDPIKGTDILEDLTGQIAQLEQMDVVLKSITAGLQKQSSASAGNARAVQNKKDTDSLKALNTELEKQRQIEQGLTQTQKLAVENQVALSNAKSAYAKELKDTIALESAAQDSLVVMRVKLRDLNKEYDNAAAASRSQLKPAIQELTKQLNDAEQATGRYQRQIGNYHDNTLKYAKGLKGLAGLGNSIASFFGFDTQGIAALKEAATLLKDYSHAQQAEIAATEGHTAAKEAELAATEAETVAEGISTGGIAAIVTVVGLAIAALWNYISAKKADTELTLQKIEDDKLVKESQEKTIELLNEETKSLIKLKVLKGEMSKEQGEQTNITLEQQEKIRKLNEEHAKQRAKLAIDSKIESSAFNSSGVVPESDIKTRQVMHEKGDINVPTEQYESLSPEEINKRKQFNATLLKLEKEYQEQYTAIVLKADIDHKTVIAEQDKDDNDNAKRRVELIKDGRTHDIGEEQLRYNEEKKHAIEKNENLELVEELHRKKLVEIDKKYFDEAKAEAERQSAALAKIEDQDLKDRLKEIKDIQSEWDAAVKAAEDQSKVLAKIEEIDLKKKLDKEKEVADARKKMLDEDLAATEAALNEKNTIQESALKTQTEMLGTEAQVQAKLAAAGSLNSLDATLKAQAKAAEEQKQLAKKAAREQEDIALAKLFIDADSAFLKSGSTPAEAASKAIQQVFLAKGIAAGISGSLFDGTADTGGAGNADSRGGKTYILHPNEAVIPKKRNEENPGLAQAWIDGNVDQYLKSMYLQKLTINVDEKINDAKITEQIVEKIATRIENAIANQKVKTAYKNGNDTVIEEEKGGTKIVRIIKHSPLIGTNRA